MKDYSSGDIVMLHYTFGSGTTAKSRPALVMLDTGDDDIVVAKITSHAARWKYDIPILSWRQAGLIRPSVVRINKLGTFEKSDVQRTMGHIAKSDWGIIRGAFQKMLTLT